MRTLVLTIALFASTVVALPAIAAGPLEVTSNVLVESKSRAADGTTRVALQPAHNAVPGDRLVFRLAYRNTGTQPLANIVLDNPVPFTLAYRAPAEGSAPPDLSVDGRTYGRLADLKVRTAAGTLRAARLEDVTHVRWRLARPLAPSAHGQLAFQAALR